jgi:hypothetical protein
MARFIRQLSRQVNLQLGIIGAPQESLEEIGAAHFRFTEIAQGPRLGSHASCPQSRIESITF